MACNFFDIDLEVYMVKVSYHQKPYRRIIMENFGATVYPGPSDHTHYGQSVLAQDPNSPGSLGIAISEAVEAAASSGGAKKYSLGSVLGHVLMHQTVVGQKALQQMEMAGEYPDFVTLAPALQVQVSAARAAARCATSPASPTRSCTRTSPPARPARPAPAACTLRFARAVAGCEWAGVIAVEPASCPSMTRGKYTFDYGDTAATPALALSQRDKRSASVAPSVSALVNHGDIEARAVHQLTAFEAAVQFSKAEGIIPAPASAHAIRVAIDEALKCKQSGEKKVIAFNLSGHGHFDTPVLAKRIPVQV